MQGNDNDLLKAISQLENARQRRKTLSTYQRSLRIGIWTQVHKSERKGMCMYNNANPIPEIMQI